MKALMGLKPAHNGKRMDFLLAATTYWAIHADKKFSKYIHLSPEYAIQLFWFQCDNIDFSPNLRESSLVKSALFIVVQLLIWMK